MCDCLTDLEPQMISHLLEEKQLSIRRGVFINTGLKFGVNVSRQTYQVFEYEGMRKLKDGVTERPFKYKTAVYHTFCPFCGKKYGKEKSPDESGDKE